MRILGAEDVDRALPYDLLAERLEQVFREGCTVPPRQHHRIADPGGQGGMLLLMPAWRAGRHLGLKSVTVFPGNASRGLPTVMGLYLLLDATTGEPLAAIDGVALTLRRTAAASALASRHLSRSDSSRLLMVGAGALARHLVAAHALVRPIGEVAIWNRTAARAEALAAELRRPGFSVAAAPSLEAAVGWADVISCATMSRSPLVQGNWLRPGAHLDLVGGFTPEMREADDAAIARARVFVDSRDGAGTEAGDIVQPIAAGVLAAQDIVADLAELARGAAGRRSAAEITLFKSVGTALEDLAAAELVLERI